MKQIFEPVKMNHIELKNRLIRSATWEGIANPDGSVTSEAYEIYEELAKGGIGAIEVSGNGTSVAGIKAHVNEGYFVPATARIAGAVSCPVIVVGGFRSLEKMEEVLNKTDIELISLSRPLLREPDLPNKMKTDPNIISKCVSCNACYSSQAHRCIFRKK